MQTREGAELSLAKERLIRISIILVGWLAFGTAANLAIRGDGLGDAAGQTVNLLAYLERKADVGGWAWVLQIALLHGGTVITWYFGGYLVDLVMDKHFRRSLREAKRRKEIEALANHVVICGGGRVGAGLAKMLAEAQQTFVIIESDPHRAAELREEGHVVVEGDARDEPTLRHAGLAHARRVVAALPSAERNVFVVLAAKRLRPDVVVDARCEEERFSGLLKQAGAARVVLPEQACVEQLVTAGALGP